MLVNNFKRLLSFCKTGTVKNVLGNEVEGYDVLQWAEESYTTNNHNYRDTVRSFNYNWTTNGNSFISEQTTYDWIGLSRNTNSNNVFFAANGFTLFVGTGETPVTPDDYKLDNPLTLNVLNACCIENEDKTITTTRIFQNITGNEVTIKEIGLYLFRSWASGNSLYSGGSTPIVMIGRKVLETPITLADGECYTFSYTIDMNKISFAEADN